ncbi:MAG: polysaccharide biosynthesis tyrosine autokinase [Bacteroidales bacterium]|nr:polysaccharide biosynthesis tyrosine autokinase [Bacteroidales bacterium]
MSTVETTTQSDGTVTSNRGQEPIKIQDFLYICLAKWYWFVISVFFCLGLAVAYILVTPKIYTRTASILVKDDSKGKSISNELSSFSDFGMFASNTNVNNEMGQLKSPDLMEQVVIRLRLDYDYLTDGTFHKNVVYGNDLPYVAEFIDVEPTSDASLQMDINPLTTELTFSDYKLDDLEDLPNDEVKGMPGDTVRTPLGRVLVLPTGQGVPEPGSDEEPITRLYISKTNMHDVIDNYTQDLSVSQDDEKSNIIVLGISNTSIQRAEDILNTLIGVYNENWVKDKNQIAVSTSMFITDRLGVIENELGNVDQDISSFKSQHLLPDVATAAKMAMEQANDAELSVQALNTQIYMARYILGNLSNENNKYQLLPTNSGISNEALAAQIAEFNKALLDRNSLVSHSSTKNPLVQEMDRALDGMRVALTNSINNEIVALEERVRSKRQMGSKATSQIASNPQQTNYLLSVERQQKVKESLYLYLLQKREENELSQAFTAYNTRIITMPHGSMKPTAPVTRNILLMAFVLGLLLPAGIIFIHENTINVIRGKKDLEGLAIPFAGEIPMHQTDGKKTILQKATDGIKNKLSKKKEQVDTASKRNIVVRPSSRDIINEAFRVMRTNVAFMGSRSGKTDIWVVTSFNPGSGKSFIAMNLAASFAIRKKKVLVIDGDLRHGSTSAYVNSPKNGLVDYLSGKVNDFRGLIVKDEKYPDLNVMPIGRIPPNPTELIEDPRFGKMIEELRSDYDYIFIDCPPIDMVADTQIISNLADRTIFVVRSGLLDRSMVPELGEIYKAHRFKNMSLVLNGTETSTNRYGYKYGYKYGYRAGYGYVSRYDSVSYDHSDSDTDE